MSGSEDWGFSLIRTKLFIGGLAWETTEGVLYRSEQGLTSFCVTRNRKAQGVFRGLWRGDRGAYHEGVHLTATMVLICASAPAHLRHPH
eukprot:8599958-Pyramimonas_sp.AAC.1